MSSVTTKPSSETAKGRRVTIDLTPGATEEVDRLKAMTDLSTKDVFTHAMSLFRIYVDAKARGEELRILDPTAKSQVQTRIELPITIRQS